MSNQKITVATALKLGLELPRAEQSTYFRMPALKIDGEMFMVQPSHRSAEPDSIVVCVGFAERDRLIADEPDVFYVKEHYEPYPVVLVRLRRIKREALRRLLRSAYEAVSTGGVKPGRRRARK